MHNYPKPRPYDKDWKTPRSWHRQPSVVLDLIKATLLAWAVLFVLGCLWQVVK